MGGLRFTLLETKSLQGGLQQPWTPGAASSETVGGGQWPQVTPQKAIAILSWGFFVSRPSMTWQASPFYAEAVKIQTYTSEKKTIILREIMVSD